MSFAEMVNRHVAFMAATHRTGEEIEYRPHGSEVFSAISALVERAPVSLTEGVLVNGIQVVLRRADLPTGRPTLDEDEIRLAQRSPGESQAVYTVIRIVDESPGHVTLEAVK